MSDKQRGKDYGPTGCFNRSFLFLLAGFGLFRVARRWAGRRR